MKNQLNRDLVEGISESSNQEFSAKVNQFVYDLVSNAINDVSAKSPFIRPEKCVLIPVNESYTGAFSQLSEYSYFLGVDNIQIELNSKTKKNYLKYLWKEFKSAWRIGRKKRKKKRKKNKEDEKSAIISIDKYKLSDLRSDLASKMADYLQESSIIYSNSNYLSLIGKDDFGTNVKVNVFVCCYDSKTNIFKVYNESKNKYFSVDFGQRFENLDAKTESIGENFANMIKIVNALYSKAYNKIPNQILVESLLINCPKKLYVADIYQTFINVTNYIRLSDPKSFKSVCDLSKNIFEEVLITKTSSQVEFVKIINMLDKYKY